MGIIFKNNVPVQWLLAGEPWLEYRTSCDFPGRDETDPAVRLARQRMLEHAQVQYLVEGRANWPGTVIASHKSAGQPFHKLTFLAIPWSRKCPHALLLFSERG